jgi:hypothetical protein
VGGGSGRWPRPCGGRRSPSPWHSVAGPRHPGRRAVTAAGHGDRHGAAVMVVPARVPASV